MKKVTSLLCCFLALVLLSGCAAMLEGDYTSVRQHKTGTSDEFSSFPVIQAATYEEILGALMSMITDGDEFGVIRIISYDGNVEAAINEACMEVSNDTALGSYAVYYLTGTVNRIISYYDVEISITYRKTPLEIANVTPVNSLSALDKELRYYLGSYSTGNCVSLSLPEVTPAYVIRRVSELYYEDPSLISALPEVTVTEYPPNGEERILELTFRYPYTVARLKDMGEKSAAAAEELVAGLGDIPTGEAVLFLAQTLAATVEYDLEREQNSSAEFHRSDLAFGALIDGKASGLGYAMAMKLLCDEIGVECMVVQGRRDSMDHGWNIIRLSEDYYHVDASVFSQVGAENAYLLGDGWMSDRCWWDTSLYPACEGPLAYGDFAPAQTTPEPTVPPSPSDLPEDLPSPQSEEPQE